MWEGERVGRAGECVVNGEGAVCWAVRGGGGVGGGGEGGNGRPWARAAWFGVVVLGLGMAEAFIFRLRNRLVLMWDRKARL